MGEIRNYLIAGHKVTVDSYDTLPDGVDPMPSFKPFLSTCEGNAVMHATIDRTYCPNADNLEKTSSFLSNGNDYKMYRRSDGSIMFAIRNCNHSPLAIIDMEPRLTKSHIAVVPYGSADYIRTLSSALLIAYTFATSHLNTLTIHSSTVVYNGKAYMFLGDSGTGKSTHSQSWLRNFSGCELLNDDNPIVRLHEGSATVYGSPWSGKTPCYKQKNAPIGAMVKLVQAKHNSISRLGSIDAFTHLLSSVSTLICDNQTYESTLDSTIRLTETVPVYELENLPDDAAAQLCKSTIVCP